MFVLLNKIKTWQAALVITIFGFAVYFDGLKNPFLGDDLLQIVNNVPVHSIANIRIFFEGSTFYTGHGLAPLSGSDYRPLMTTVFSILYSIFGPHPFYYHVLQLLICISSTLILYLIFKYSFRPTLALFLSLIFLLHPIDSQVVFAIASMQDALFFFFGILALYLLTRWKSVRSLTLVCLCLFLSLLSKEAGFSFIVVAGFYLFWYNRKRLLPFIGIMVAPVVLYLVLRANAIGWHASPNNAPIDNLGLADRLLTTPSIICFYMFKFIFPWKLAAGYYWTYSRFSISHFLIPLIIDLGVVSAVVMLLVNVRKKFSKEWYVAGLFFASWTAVGLVAYLQILALDMTTSETWFYFAMVGVLGMIGVVLKTFGSRLKVDSRVLLLVMLCITLALGVRTAERGRDWRSEFILVRHDASTSKEDFVADSILATDYIGQGKYSQAKFYASRSITIYPGAVNYDSLGESLFMLNNYPGAYQAYLKGLTYQSTYPLYDNLAVLTAYYGDTNTNIKLLIKGTQLYPNQVQIWFYLALLEYKAHNLPMAKLAITEAYKYGQSYEEIPVIYNTIMNNQTLSTKL